MANRVSVTVFLLVFFCTGTASAQDSLRRSLVDFDCVACSPADALARLSRQTGINITFNTTIFRDCPPVTLAARQEPMEDVLGKIAGCARPTYRWSAGQVVVFRKIERYTLSGYVKDGETGERLIGASVRVRGAGAITNEFGFFSMELEGGAYRLAVACLGYQTDAYLLELDSDRVLIFDLKPNTALPEVVISAPTPSESNSGQSGGQHNLPFSATHGVPMPGGEIDLLRMAAFQPGVQTGVDGLGGLHVRGGNADQNLFLLDDVPVYNPSHALGLFSVFNPATISSARLWKGDFPARYSGRTASVIDVRTRDGNLHKHNVELSAGLFAASATVEGPIKRDTSSFLVSGRTTYLGPWIDFFSKRDNLLAFSGDNIAYRFYDVNLKLNYLFSEKSRIYLSYYQGGDVFRNGFSQRFDNLEGQLTDQYTLGSEWGNSIAALRWNYLLKNNLFTNTTVRFSRFFYESKLTLLSTFLGATGRESLVANYGQIYQTLIEDLSLKTDFSFFPKNNLDVRWGFSYTLHAFQPGALSVNFLVAGQSSLTIDSLSNSLLNNERLGADESELYVEADWRFGKHWSLEAGFNLASFQVRNSVFRAPQPRLRLQFGGNMEWRAWVGYHRSAQFLHQIGSFNISLPFELWVPTTARVAPEHVWQASAGVGLRRSGWNIQVEGYYKRLERVLAFLSTSTALFAGGAEDASGWEDRIAAGTGLAYGIEAIVEKRFSSTSINLVYAWSRSERQFPEINSGRVFPFRFDRQHDFKITVEQHLAPWLDITLAWVYATGNPITLSGVKYQHHTPNGEIERNVFVYTDVNGYRLPPYHRLDAALNARFGAGRFKHTVQLGVYNAYNRFNPFFLYVDSGSGTNAKAIQYTLLPFVPSFRYSLKF
ncbi:MAG: carboxypeptidase-like regulatory domain-containing protein [Saprospiraceae bacterium]